MKIIGTFFNLILRIAGLCAVSAILSSCLAGGDANTDASIRESVPVITSITHSGDGLYSFGQSVQLTLTFNQVVDVVGVPRISMGLNVGQGFANYSSGSGSTILVFTYVVGTSHSDNDGVTVNSLIDLSGGNIQSSFGVDSSLDIPSVDSSALLVDGISPTIVSVTPPPNGNFTSSTTTDLDFTVVYDDTVIILGTPQLDLMVGSNTRNATYVSGSGTTSLLFRYTVVAADMDMDGITLSSSIDLNSGTIKDNNGNDAGLSLTSPDLSSVTVTFPGIELWLDSNDTNTILDAEGDQPGDPAFGNIVATWSDKSGLGNDATQTTGGAEPAYVTNAINTNMSVIRFDGVNDFLITTYDANINNVIFTVFAHDHTGISTPHGPVWQTQANVGTSGFFPAYSNGSQYVASAGWVTKASTFTRNQFYYTTVIANNTGNLTELYDDGNFNHSGATTQPAGNNFQIGKRNGDIYRGDVTEIIIFNRVLDGSASGEIDQIEAYLANKWGL